MPGRVMKARLQALAADCAREPGSPLGDRVDAMMCLASFLSYIAFDSATGCRPDCSPSRATPAQASQLTHASGRTCGLHIHAMGMLSLERAAATFYQMVQSAHAQQGSYP